MPEKELPKKRKPRPLPHKVRYPDLEIPQILDWADDFHRRTGNWPTKTSGPVVQAPGTTWCGIDLALKRGNRGLIGGSSLARLLQDWRGTRNIKRLPPLTYDLILSWADAHFARTGKWPNKMDGAVEDAPGEKWVVIDMELRIGGRGLPGGMSLARLIARERGVRNQTTLPLFTEDEILAWADAHYRCTGRWPTTKSGAIPEAPSENWRRVNNAFIYGLRGLPGGSSLPQFLDRHRRQKDAEGETH